MSRPPRPLPRLNPRRCCHLPSLTSQRRPRTTCLWAWTDGETSDSACCLPGAHRSSERAPSTDRWPLNQTPRRDPLKHWRVLSRPESGPIVPEGSSGLKWVPQTLAGPLRPILRLHFRYKMSSPRHGRSPSIMSGMSRPTTEWSLWEGSSQAKEEPSQTCNRNLL